MEPRGQHRAGPAGRRGLRRRPRQVNAQHPPELFHQAQIAPFRRRGEVLLQAKRAEEITLPTKRQVQLHDGLPLLVVDGQLVRIETSNGAGPIRNRKLHRLLESRMRLAIVRAGDLQTHVVHSEIARRLDRLSPDVLDPLTLPDADLETAEAAPLLIEQRAVHQRAHPQDKDLAVEVIVVSESAEDHRHEGDAGQDDEG